MKTTLCWLAALSVLSTPVTVAAQAAGAVADAAAQAAAQAEATSPEARIEAAMESAAQANVPVSLLASKVAEGEAKRVPLERVAAAVEARLASLVRASDALRRAGLESWTEGELSVTADALEAGVSENAVIRVSQDAPAERRVVAIAVLSDLVRLGNESEPALLRVTSALSTNTALANLQAEVASQLRLGGLIPTLDVAGLLEVR